MVPLYFLAVKFISSTNKDGAGKRHCLVRFEKVSFQSSFSFSVDNSEWMRNGDLAPTRLQSQQEAVNLVIQCKLRANPESGVGLLSMAKYFIITVTYLMTFLAK